MALADFDPSKVVVLDWYEVLVYTFPEIDVLNKEECNHKLKEIFDIVDKDISFSFYPGWLSFDLKDELRENAKEQKFFLKKNPHYDNLIYKNFALSWLLPSGTVLHNVEHRGVISRFTYEDKDYVYTNDGSLISLEPVLYDCFLPKYIKGKTLDASSQRMKDLEYLEI